MTAPRVRVIDDAKRALRAVRKPKRAVYRVQFDRHSGNWVAHGETSRHFWSLKTFAVLSGRALAVNYAASGPGRTAQLVIYRKDGRIQSERTYPRSSDPARRRG